MRLFIQSCSCAVLLFSATGCIQLEGNERNPFLTLTEFFGAPTSGDATEEGAGGGFAVEGEFRRTMTVTLANNNTNAELNTTVVAWVEASSIRSAAQQDALLNSGYIQLKREVQLGVAFSLPTGTFVFGGPGEAGGTAVTLGAAGADPATATTREFSMITPDVILVYSQPPTSCDSVAFFYTIDGDVLFSPNVGGGIGRIFGGATNSGGLKTLAQIDAYQCEPLKPGMFLKLGGGIQQPNEFFEGENVRFDFFELPDANGNFANVTIM